MLLGRSGAGKTTALKLINRLLEPSSGQVCVEGRSTVDWDPIALRRRIGYVIQEAGLFPHYTVEQNVSLVPRLEKWPADRIEARFDQLGYRAAGTGGLRDRRVHRLHQAQPDARRRARRRRR